MNTEKFLSIALLGIFTVVFTFVGLQEVFPIFINVFVYLLGVGFLVWSILRWENLTRWRWPTRTLILVLATFLYCSLLSYPVRKQYSREHMTLSFKDDEAFNWWNKFVIERQFINVRTYLVDLNIPVPKDIPQIDVGENNADTSGFRDPAYLGNLGINRFALERGDKQRYPIPYLDFVMERIFLVHQPSSQAEVMRQGLLFQTFAHYFLSSWSGNTEQLSDWSRQMWQVRERMGKQFTDQLMAYALKTVIDAPNEGQNSDDNIYFCNHLRIGYSALSDHSDKWRESLRAMTPIYARSCPAN